MILRYINEILIGDIILPYLVGLPTRDRLYLLDRRVPHPVCVFYASHEVLGV